MARQFIGGTNPAEAVAQVAALWDGGYANTVDLLGERTLTLADADVYAERVRSMLDVVAPCHSGVDRTPSPSSGTRGATFPASTCR